MVAARGLGEGKGDPLLFTGYRVSVLQDEKSAGDVLFNSVGLVNPTVHLKVLSWCILCYVFF